MLFSKGVILMQPSAPDNPLLSVSQAQISITSPNNNRLIAYAALGDSIAFGMGASQYNGYVYQFHRFLWSKYQNIRLIMLARPGFTSSNLLWQLLYNTNARYIVQNASLITISIGGNNLLKSACRNYTVIYPNLAEAGIRCFAADWPEILNMIRNVLGSNAIIYVMTLYNPYKADDPLYSIVNSSVQKLNSVISDCELKEKYRYDVIDVYSHFKKNELKNWTGFSAYKRNPHPNNEGHAQIALLHEEASGV